MKSIATSAVTSKGETVIPRPMREKLGLRPGDRLRYTETLDGIVIERRGVWRTIPSLPHRMGERHRRQSAC